MPRIATVVQRHLALYLYRKHAVEKTQLLYFTDFILEAEDLQSTKKITLIMYVSVFVSGISSSLHRKPLQSRKTFTDIWF
jgi:hypothetical protein